ncbi:MAG: MOSC domain-containing protein [Salibacteraceae bacterium]
MHIVSTNLAQPFSFEWNGETVESGIYKCPVSTPLELQKGGVVGDKVVDLRVHGGPEKACYLYSEDHYPEWQALYPNLEWQAGMFGENLTVAGLNETQTRIDDVFQVGTAKVQVSAPRQPCFKLGMRFGNMEVLRQFVKKGKPGAYIRVLTPGKVQVGDAFQLLETNPEKPTLEAVHWQKFRR